MHNQPTLPGDGEPTQPVVTGVEQGDKKTGDGNGPVDRGNESETMAGLTKARLSHPEMKLLKNKIYEEVKEVIEQDPSLVYEDETDSAYTIHNHAEEVLVVPKERAIPEPYPAQRAEPIRKAYRFLLWAALGLIFSGLGAIFLAPAAGLYALRGLNGPLSQQDSVRGQVILSMAVVVFLAGAALTYLLLLHWVG